MRYFEEPNPNDPQAKFPCGICSKNINKNHHYLQCSLCNYRCHIKCNKIDPNTFVKMKKIKDFICLACKEENIPFQTLSDNQFIATVSQRVDIEVDYGELSVLPPENLRLFFKELNEFNGSNIIEENSPLNCKYYDINTFPSSKMGGKSFSLFHLNIVSLSKNKDELETLLKMLDSSFDIIGLTETKIIKGCSPTFNLKLNGYKHYHTPTESTHGGALLYVSDLLDHEERKDLNSILYKPKLLESVFIEIKNPGKKNVIVGCMYKHPLLEIDNFNDDFLEHFLEKLSCENKDIFLIGDFNTDLINSDIEPISSFLDTMTTNLFVPHITLPTRITPTSSTLIDNIYSNITNFSTGISGNLTSSISDHFPQFLILPKEIACLPRKHNLYKRDTKHFVKESFISDLISIDWPSVLQINKNDPNYSFDSFDLTLNNILDKHLPMKKITKKDYKQQFKPWITMGIRISIKRRDSILKNYIRCKNIIKKRELHANYKNLRNTIVTLIRTSKKNHYQNFFFENTNNIRQTWKGIKSIINIRNTSKSCISSLKIDEKISSDPTDMANSFNNYFSSIGKDLQKNIYYYGNNFTNYLKQPNDYNFFINPTDEVEIINLIDNLCTNKATGPHSIPTDILQLIKFNIATPLSEIINLSFSTGIYPDNLKTAEVIPIYKDKGSMLQCCNYRPISLLSNINKIYEKMMHSRLYNFLNIHNCIYELQFGFRENHSTIHALLSLTENIREVLDNNSFACGIFIDLQKAFDTVDHTILLKKLNFYGIRGITNDWFKSYLSNRKQFVSINGFKSETRSMEFGVPQGSVLGPLLFVLYINDLHCAIKYSLVHHFADDTNLLLVNKSLKQLQKHINIDLKILQNWLKANKISLNASKTELIIFRHPNKKINYNLKIKLDGKILHPSDYVKYLGILMDSSLNWRFQSNALTTKLCRANGMLSKIRHYVPSNTLRMIYFGIFHSIMSYGSQIWGQFLNPSVKKISKLQNRSIRIINFAHFRTPVNMYYKQNNILKLTDIVQLNNFLLVHDHYHNNLPAIFNNMFSYTKDLHSHNTRGSKQQNICFPKVNTQTYGINSIKYQSIKFWNTINKTLPNDKLPLKKKSHCKKIISKYILNNY